MSRAPAGSSLRGPICVGLQLHEAGPEEFRTAIVLAALKKGATMEYRNRIFNMDCLAGMSMLPTASVDMVLTDLPYGTTAGAWDKLLPLDMLWRQLHRVAKPTAAMAFTAAQPFTTQLIQSNQKEFRYCWYWIKSQVTGFPFSHFQPLRCVEEVVVFYRKRPTYNPQGLVALEKPKISKGRRYTADSVYREGGLARDTEQLYTNYPRQVLTFSCQREGLHPTQKPVALFEYLVRTYTNPGDLVLDCCMGSGTTKVACRNSDRDYVGFEVAEKYYKIALER